MSTDPVSYTHLVEMEILAHPLGACIHTRPRIRYVQAVSYTHLEVLEIGAVGGNRGAAGDHGVFGFIHQLVVDLDGLLGLVEFVEFLDLIQRFEKLVVVGDLGLFFVVQIVIPVFERLDLVLVGQLDHGGQTADVGRERFAGAGFRIGNKHDFIVRGFSPVGGEGQRVFSLAEGKASGGDRRRQSLSLIHI